MNPAKLTTAIHSRLSEFLDSYALIAFDVNGDPVVIQHARDKKSRLAIFHLMDTTSFGVDDNECGSSGSEEATDG